MFNNKLRSRRGTAVVELALAGTLLFMIAFMASDFSHVLYDAIAVANGAGSAAFYGADDNVRAGDFNLIGQQAKDDSENDLGTVTPTVSQMCQCPDGGAEFDCQLYQETSCGTYGIPRAYVKVEVEDVYESLSGLFTGITVKRESYMRVQ